MSASRASSAKNIEKSDEAFRSIGEAAGELGIEAHVIRYWETRFPRDVKPVKRPDGRRLFRPEDMDALRAVQCLVRDHGLTLKNAKRVLDEQGVNAVLAGTAEIETPVAEQANPARALQSQLTEAYANPAQKEKLVAMLPGLTILKARLDAAIAISARV